METCAAVAYKAGEPLTIETVQLMAQKTGRFWSRSRRPGSAIPTSSRCPEPIQGLFRAILGHEGPVSLSMSGAA